MVKHLVAGALWLVALVVGARGELETNEKSFCLVAPFQGQIFWRGNVVTDGLNLPTLAAKLAQKEKKLRLEEMILLSESIEIRVRVTLFRIEELRGILTERKDISCLEVLDQCKDKFGIIERDGIGPCLWIGRGLIDHTSPNGLGYFVPDDTKFSIVNFKNWTHFGQKFSDAVRVMASAAIEDQTGVITFSDLRDKFRSEVSSVALNADLCPFHSFKNDTISMIRHVNCNIHASQITKAYVVNLRNDVRLAKFMRQIDASLSKLLPIERFDALNGKLHARLTPPTRRLFREKTPADRIKFPYTGHEFQLGVLGCAMSHLIIWKEISLDETLDDLDAVLVFEDDVIIPDSFAQNWRIKWIDSDVRLDPRWDILYLTFLDDLSVYKSNPIWNFARTFSRNPRSYGGGTSSYIIRKKGARRLVELAKSDGVFQPIDWFMFSALSYKQEVLALKFSPPLVRIDNSVESTTDEPYEIGFKQACYNSFWNNILTEKEQKMPYKVSILQPQQWERVSPDARVFLAIFLPPGSSSGDFSEANLCLKVCYGLRPMSPGVPPPVGSQCVYVFDQQMQNETFLDYSDSIQLARETAGIVTIFASALDKEGNVLADSGGDPIPVIVDREWLQISQKCEANDVVLTISTEKHVESFLSKHGSDMICIEGFRPCVHLASLPRRVAMIESSYPSQSFRRMTLNSLGGELVYEGKISVPNPEPTFLNIRIELSDQETICPSNLHN